MIRYTVIPIQMEIKTICCLDVFFVVKYNFNFASKSLLVSGGEQAYIAYSKFHNIMLTLRWCIGGINVKFDRTNGQICRGGGLF